MPKIIELTVEIDIQRVSCPGVWLCQDGRVSLTVFALGTSYQTCMLPPTFPLTFKDVFYFRKTFQETCALNNICCLLKDETIYCELVQWSENCQSGECIILAQYLGAVNDVLFPPNMCSSDGVDLLMRRSKDFPGILSPKIEIATKVRIDEVWNQPCHMKSLKLSTCHCRPSDVDGSRQKQVCHSAQYHRNKCNSSKKVPSLTRSRSRSRSGGSRSCCSLIPEPEMNVTCGCPNPTPKCSSPRTARPASRPRGRNPRHYCPQYNVYSVRTVADCDWINATTSTENSECDDYIKRSGADAVIKPALTEEEYLQKTTVESRYIDPDRHKDNKLKERWKKHVPSKITPCVCDICKRYHELFHTQYSSR